MIEDFVTSVTYLLFGLATFAEVPGLFPWCPLRDTSFGNFVTFPQTFEMFMFLSSGLFYFFTSVATH